jgi:hypothetical protein
MNSSSQTLDMTTTNTTMTTQEQRAKQSKLSVFSRIFKPWKWKRRKKPSEKIQKTAIGKELRMMWNIIPESLAEWNVWRVSVSACCSVNVSILSHIICVVFFFINVHMTHCTFLLGGGKLKSTVLIF